MDAFRCSCFIQCQMSATCAAAMVTTYRINYECRGLSEVVPGPKSFEHTSESWTVDSRNAKTVSVPEITCSKAILAYSSTTQSGFRFNNIFQSGARSVFYSLSQSTITLDSFRCQCLNRCSSKTGLLVSQ